MKNSNLLNRLLSYSHEKQSPQRFARYAAILIMLLTLGVGQMWGGASWIGNSFIVFNGTWYNGSGSGQSKSFNGQTLGKISSLTLGGEAQTYGQSSGTSNPARMYYKFDSGSSAYLTLYWYCYQCNSSNNNFFHTNSNGSTTSGNAFASKSIDISGLSAGDHTLSIWFYQPDGGVYDSNNSANYVATITVNPLVTFKANGGTGSDYTQRVTYNTNTALTANTFTRTGYDFAGWATSADGNVVYAGGANVKLTAHTNLFAKWTPQTYNITYKDKGDVAFSGTHEDGYPTTHTYGTATTLDSPTKDGYTFGGWYTNSTCTTSAGASIGATAKTADFTLYAKWTANEYTVTLDREGGTTGDTEVTATYASAMPSATMPTRTGYDFGGYYTSAGGSGTKYYNTDGSSNHVWDVADDATIHAKWTEKTYNVTVTSNNFSYGTVMGGQTSSQTVSAKHFTSDCAITAENLSGYRFTGWTYSGSVVIADATAASTTIKATATGATVTANFEALPSGQLDIVAGLNGKVKKQGGDWGSSASYTDINTDQDLNIYAQANTGYHFVNWTKSGDGSIKTNAADGVYTLTARGSATVTANFAASSYTVTLDKQSGSGGPESVSATYNAAMPTPTTMPTRTGYDFNGYYGSTGGSGTKYYNSDGSSNHVWDVASATSIYAYWTIKNYTITYSPSSAPTGCTYTTKPTSADYNTTVDMVITPSTGYTVSVSAVDASSNTVTVTPGANNHYTFTQPASAVTVTVTATETMSTLTTANSYTGADPSFAAPTMSVSSIGIATSATVTAASNSLGYTLTSWTITGGTRIDGGAANANPITVRSNGDGAAVSVTANYVGSNRLVNIYLPNTGNSWSTSDANWRFYKLPGESGNTVTLAVDINKNSYSSADYQLGFNIYQGGWDDKWWHNKSDGHSYMHAHNCTNWGFNTKDGDYRTYLDLNVSGTYTFTLTNSTTSSTQKLSVTYPDKSFIEGAFPTAWNEDAYTLSEDGDIQSVTINITSTGDKTFRLVSHGKLFGTTTTFTAASNSHTLTAKKMSDGSDALMTIAAYLTGEYTFSYNKSTKKLTVTWPIYNQVRISNASPADATNVGNFDLSAPVSNVRTVTRSLEANTTYTFKVVYNSEWYGKNSGAFTRNTSTSSNTETIITSGGDMTLTTDYAGDYTFRFNQSTKELSIDFPEAYKVTYGKGSVDGSSGNNCSAVDLDNSSAAVTSNSTWVKRGHQVELTAPNEDGGYTFDGWFDSDAGTGTEITTAKNCTITVASAETYYACYHENLTAVTITTDGHGTITTPNPNNSPYSLGVATMQDINATANEGYHWNTWTTSGNAALGTTATTASNTAKGNGTEGGAGTVTATFSPNTYTIHFNGNGSTSGEMTDQTGVTYDAATTITANAFGRTGYNFAGWATTQERANAGTVDRTDGAAHGNLASTQGETAQLWAVWTAKTTTISYSQSGTGYGSGGQSTTQTAIYDAAMPTPISTPTAANGWAFMGYYDALEPLGTQYYDETGASARTWNKEDATATLYAYFKQAEITGITFTDGAVVAPSTSKTVTAVIEPTPTGTTTVCWRVLYSNDNPLDPQPEFSSVSGNSVSFTAPATSGMYKMEAVLHLGSGCGGEELSTYVAPFQVAGDHEVTVQYKDASGNVIAASGSVTGKPLEWTEVVAHEIFGYTYSGMTAGDGVTLRDTTAARLAELQAEDPTIVGVKRMKAVYDGKLTINYTQNQMIYFKNTLGWDNVFVNFHTGNAWNNEGNGSGSPKGVGNSGLTPRNKHMIQIGESDVYYYDYGAESIDPSLYISFTNKSRDGVAEFWGDNPDGIAVVYPANYPDAISTDKSDENGFKAATPMFVPLSGIDPVAANVTSTGKANYYNAGYWTMYTPGTGYTLEIYYDSDESSCIQSIPFTSEDDLMPMSAVVDLEANSTYRYQVRRGGTESAGIYYGNTGTMTYANHGVGTGWIMENTMAGGFKKAKITTNAAGNYTFNLSYSPNASSEYRLRMEVDYPIADGDYRLIYTDATRDSGTRYKPSAIVTKANNSKDTVSFFIRPSSSPVLKIQQASVTNAGVITWGDLSDISSSVSSLSKDSVYNICLTMNGSGVISVENVEAYTGNFYIRTNAAGASKWDNYRSSDHLMTYSEYSATNADYSHYFMAYVGNGTNVKFVVANDYSPCISDTIKVQTYRDGDASHVNVDGDIQADANVRFMWNRHNNGAYRAYLAAAKSDGSKFLVLRANSNTDLMDENGNALINSANSGEAGYNHKAPDNSMQFIDNENWIYETTVKIKPGAFLKLYANFHNADFYYKGENNSTFDEDNAIQLLGGSGDAEKIRVIYDFKTDRLVSAWMPTGDIDEVKEIYADVMFVREHQGDIEQLTFSKGDGETMGAITKIETAYGVLRFNKWTINNKSKADGHAVLDPGASRYERDLFYVSFPFRVAMNEVFGFGTYGKHWIIEYYDGAARALNGFWADTPTYWRFVTDRKGKFFEPNQGYIIALDLDELGEDSEVWDNGVENVELYFPSYGTMGDITNATVVQKLPSHECTINRPTANGDRRIKDSHWNVMSVPTYVNTSSVAFANTTWTADCPSFLYEWNMGDNSLTPRSGSGYTYHAMHAYIVQYEGDVTWSSTSVTPAAAPNRNPDAPADVEYRLELQQNDVAVDQAFVRLSNEENVSAGFAFGEDMSKEFNKNRSNIYTFIGKEQVAGNCLPMTEQTTVVPVGVIAKTTGDYTFALPEGTNGVGVTLIDNETGVRTSLSALDYTVNLNAGTYNERFVLEISPIHHMPTGIEEVSDERLEVSGARKLMIDGILYIVKDGIMYDAQGKRIQ